jgi:hypothetical protein
MSAERLLALLQAPRDRPLPPELQEWLREGLRAAVLDHQSLAAALELKGSHGRPDGPARVRRWIRDGALFELGQRLEPGARRSRMAAAVFDAYHGHRALDPESRQLLALACRMAGVPAHLRNLVELFRAMPAETPVFDRFALRRAS